MLFFLLANVSFAIAQSRIKSTVTGGSWSTTFTWIGGVIPSSLNTVEVVPGSNVTLNILSTIVAKADIKGTLDFASTGYFYGEWQHYSFYRGEVKCIQC